MFNSPLASFIHINVSAIQQEIVCDFGFGYSGQIIKIIEGEAQCRLNGTFRPDETGVENYINRQVLIWGNHRYIFFFVFYVVGLRPLRLKKLLNVREWHRNRRFLKSMALCQKYVLAYCPIELQYLSSLPGFGFEN